ncbi:MAG: M50 family metallopeptidase [bacterium]|nr:M50 family metallopeptidase [bacterium]
MNTGKKKSRIFQSDKSKDIGIVVGMFIVSVLLWNTFLLYPVKLFVVALHELSHGLAAIITGGRIVEIQIDYRIGGYCKYLFPADAGFFNRAFIAAAGYLGSMFWGALIFILAVRTKWDRRITFLIGCVMLMLTFFVIKSGEWFGIVFCFGFSAVLFASAKWLSDGFHDIFLKFLGLTSCLYVIIDIKEDLIDRTGIGSDADAIAAMMGVPSLSMVIGIVWIILALGVLVFTFKTAYKDEVKVAKRVRGI